MLILAIKMSNDDVFQMNDFLSNLLKMKLDQQTKTQGDKKEVSKEAGPDVEEAKKQTKEFKPRQKFVPESQIAFGSNAIDHTDISVLLDPRSTQVHNKIERNILPAVDFKESLNVQVIEFPNDEQIILVQISEESLAKLLESEEVIPEKREMFDSFGNSFHKKATKEFFTQSKLLKTDGAHVHFDGDQGTLKVGENTVQIKLFDDSLNGNDHLIGFNHLEKTYTEFGKVGRFYISE